MNGLSKGVLLLALVLLCGPVNGGDVYTCKDAKGKKAFQDVPCATTGQQVKHATYATPDPVDQDALPVTQLRVPVASRGVASASEPTAQGQSNIVSDGGPGGYECQAGNRRWVQSKPCPATYSVGRTVQINGVTTNGDFVTGTGFTSEQKPVQQRTMSSQDVCDQVNQRTKYGRGLSGPMQGYEKNKLRAENGCN